MQSSISALANNRDREACLIAAQQLRSQDGGRALAHFTACSALHASAWKRAAPTRPLTTLLDKQYRIAARLNLGLSPFSSDRQLPADCPLCSKGQNAVANDPWHFLICGSQFYREVSTRHHAVKDALYRAVLLTGGQAVREVKGLQAGSDLRPDLQIKLGLDSLAAKDSGSESFFRRLQSPELLVQSALLVLRQCAVPKLNVLLRCSPPECIAQQAADFDDTLMATACAKLELRSDERTPAVQQRLRLRLKDSGFGLTSAAQTSPAAYIASVAAARDTAVFAELNHKRSVLSVDTLLHGWLQDSLHRLREAMPGVGLDAKLLPASASLFFSFYASARSALTSSLQRSISALAHTHNREACLTAAKQPRRDKENGDDGRSLALFTACTARHASAWKRAAPTQPLSTLLDRQYHIAARLNLGLKPLSSDHQLPTDCPLCHKGESAVAKDPWHYLTCTSQKKREIDSRHNAVVDALYRAVLLTGGQAKREASGMQADSLLRPDMRIVYPGQHVLTDIAVTHSLGYRGRLSAGSQLSAAKKVQREKRDKYAAIAARHDAEFLPFVAETCGGLAPDAVELLDVISSAAAEHLSLWSRQDAAKELLDSVSIAIQKGNAMTVLGAHAAATLHAA